MEFFSYSCMNLLLCLHYIGEYDTVLYKGIEATVCNKFDDIKNIGLSFGFAEDISSWIMKDVLRCVETGIGAQYVMIAGMTLIPVWLVDNWDLLVALV